MHEETNRSYGICTSEEKPWKLHSIRSSRPPILMGDDTPLAVEGEGRLELPNGNFENVLHAPKLSINLLSVYQIT
jgi:hypothetical protein